MWFKHGGIATKELIHTIFISFLKFVLSLPFSFGIEFLSIPCPTLTECYQTEIGPKGSF